ncbi:MAG: hypothetical protein AB7E79_15915 [Rhodospirillaceae bacterium]
MTKLESSVRLVCPDCGRKGTANWVRAASNGPRKLYDFSVGFLSIDAGTKDGPRIVCQKCRIRANEHPVA